jgi:CBS domain-containing protein
MSQAPRVRDLMSSEVVTLHRNEQLSIADRIMRLGRIRHMPVLDEDGALCGIVSQRDLFRGALAHALGFGTAAQDRLLKTLRVKEVMKTQLVTTTPEAPLADAAQQMATHKIGCLPVVEDGGRLVGIVTDEDFLRWAAEHMAAG